jgi:hypothetical protein
MAQVYVKKTMLIKNLYLTTIQLDRLGIFVQAWQPWMQIYPH